MAKLPVVELLRVSTSMQAGDDRAGLPRQAEANRQTVERHDLVVVSTVRLVDVSGTATLHAPEVQDMLALLRSGRARGIVCADFDRLLRPDDFRSLAILQDIREAGAIIYLPDGTVDINTQAGFLMSGLQSIIAGNELAQIKKRMIGAKEEKRRQGKCPQAAICLPTGVSYDRQTERWSYTPESEIVRDLFFRFLSGEHNLNELQRQTGLHHRTISNLLRNEIYMGVRAYTQKRAREKRLKADGRQGDRRKVARAPDEVIRVPVIDTPLIDPEDFWLVQKILSGKRGGFVERRKQADDLFLFKGLLRCAICGEPMYTVPGGKGGHKRDYYYCRQKNDHFKKAGGAGCHSSYMRRLDVENIVLRFIAENLSNKSYVEEQVAKNYGVDRGGRQDAELTSVRGKIARLEKSRRRAIDLHVEGILDRSDLDAKLQEIKSEQERLGARQKSIETCSGPTPEDIEEVAVSVARGFATFFYWTRSEQRACLRQSSPLFWVGAEGVTKFSMQFCQKSDHRTGTGSWRTPASRRPGRTATPPPGRWSPCRPPGAGAALPARTS